MRRAEESDEEAFREAMLALEGFEDPFAEDAAPQAGGVPLREPQPASGSGALSHSVVGAQPPWVQRIMPAGEDQIASLLAPPQRELPWPRATWWRSRSRSPRAAERRLD